MLGVFIFVVIIAFLFYIQSTSNSVPAYKKQSIYKGLVGEDQLKVDLTVAIKVLVETSLRVSKENAFTEQKTNLHLIKAVNDYRSELISNIFMLSSKYKISTETTKFSINTVCDGTIGIYIPDFDTHKEKYIYVPIEGEHKLMLYLMQDLNKAIEDYLLYARTRQHSPDLIKSEIIDRINFFCNSLAPNVSEIALRFNITRSEVIETIQAVSEDTLLKYVYK